MPLAMAQEDVPNGENYLITMFKTAPSKHLIRLMVVLDLQKHNCRLKRVYILFNAKHGLNEIDRMMLQSLDEQIQSSKGNRFTLQAILTKVDTLESDSVAMVKKTQKEIFQTAPTCLPALLTSSTRRPPFGIDEVRRNIAEACGLRLR